MPEPSFPQLSEQTVVIVGVGLIGGSLAAALKHRSAAKRVIGVGRDVARIEAARRAGLIDEATTDIATTIDRADLIVFCTPVDRVAKDARLAQAALVKAAKSQSSRSLPLLTDAGSVKGTICAELADVPQFIGSHPIAGSHKQGFEAADPHLFERRMCVLTPLPSSAASLTDRLDQFWQAVGMRTVRMSPEAHDRSLAMTSHLPHLVAAALAGTLAEKNRSLTGTGFRDTTRVAAGDPQLWMEILINNADSVLHGVGEMQQTLSAFGEALAKRDGPAILALLRAGQLSRASLDQLPDRADENDG